MRWLKTAHVDAHPVLCHNDAQYGNILRLNSVEEGKPEHHQVRLSTHYLSFSSSPLRDVDVFILYIYIRSSLSTLSTLPRTLPPSISRTTSTSGQPTTMDQHHTCSTPHAIQLKMKGVPSSPPTSRVASRPVTRPSTRQRPSSLNYLPHYTSKISSRSGMLCAHGALHHMPCGRYGVSSRRERTFWHTLPSLTSII
jgi:hypothetical protein